MNKTYFVFGSNLGGIHGAGAAYFAMVEKGAVYGVGEGITGACYALPTKNAKMKTRSLRRIAASVDTFLSYARAHPSDTFEVTAIGCGLAGLNPSDIGPMFEDAPDNCKLPIEFKPYITKDFTYLTINEYS